MSATVQFSTVPPLTARPPPPERLWLPTPMVPVPFDMLSTTRRFRSVPPWTTTPPPLAFDALFETTQCVTRPLSTATPPPPQVLATLPRTTQFETTAPSACTERPPPSPPELFSKRQFATRLGPSTCRPPPGRSGPDADSIPSRKVDPQTAPPLTEALPP